MKEVAGREDKYEVQEEKPFLTVIIKKTIWPVDPGSPWAI